MAENGDIGPYVVSNSGRIPYSIGYMAQTLISAGLSPKKAYSDAYSISIRVNDLQIDEITSHEIMNMTYKWYKERAPNFALRILYLNNTQKYRSPMVLLLGGVTGVGKSTLAQHLGTTLGIKSVLSTDLLREILRVTITPHLMPMLHTSSYQAHKVLDTAYLPAISKSVFGFEEQTRVVSVSVESAIKQTIEDQELIIIEGVHLVPGLLNKEIIADPNILFVMLALENEETHRSRLTIREAKSDGRSENYLSYFSNIRRIQRYLLEQSASNDVEVIDIENDEDAQNKLINMVWDWRIKDMKIEEY